MRSTRAVAAAGQLSWTSRSPVSAASAPRSGGVASYWKGNARVAVLPATSRHVATIDAAAESGPA